MVGEGDAYFRRRAHAGGAGAAEAGLKPLEPFAADQAALISTNAYAQAQAAAAGRGCAKAAGMDRSQLCHGPQRHEFQRHADLGAGASDAAVSMADLGCRPHHGHDQGQLSVR